MKRILLILLLLTFILPLSYGRVNIIAFPGGGYSLLPESEYMIGYMNKDGTVNWDRLNWLLQNIANAGAGGWREFPYWPTQDQEFSKSVAPFRVESGKVIWNSLYFDNLGKIFRFAHEQYNLVPIFDLFNASETRVKGTKEYSPWKSLDNYFYDPDSKPIRHEWINRVIVAAGDIPVMYQIMNEPPTKAVDCTVDTYLYLIEKGIPPERILIGWDVYRKKKEPAYREAYNRWRDAVIAGLGKMPQYKGMDVGLKIIKGTSWSPIHGMHHDSARDYFQHGIESGQEVPSGSSRNTIYSTDAVNPRLDFIGGSNLAIIITQAKPDAINAGRIWIEYVIGKETNVKDPFGQLKGGIRAISGKYGYPYNKDKFPAPLPIPVWVYESPAQDIPPTKPEPGEPKITITSPSENDTWQAGSTHPITWETEGTVGDIKIEYSVDNGVSWTIITNSTNNNGSYTWIMPDIPAGKCLVKVSEVDNSPTETKEFTVTGKPKVQEQEKKKKNKTLYYIIGVAITGILAYFFIKHTLVTGIVLGLLLLAGSYYLNKKKKKLWYIPVAIAGIGWVIFGLFSNPVLTLSIVSIMSVSVNVLQFKGKIK